MGVDINCWYAFFDLWAFWGFPTNRSVHGTPPHGRQYLHAVVHGWWLWFGPTAVPDANRTANGTRFCCPCSIPECSWEVHSPAVDPVPADRWRSKHASRRFAGPCDPRNGHVTGLKPKWSKKSDAFLNLVWLLMDVDIWWHIESWHPWVVIWSRNPSLLRIWEPCHFVDFLVHQDAPFDSHRQLSDAKSCIRGFFVMSGG